MAAPSVDQPPASCVNQVAICHSGSEQHSVCIMLLAHKQGDTNFSVFSLSCCDQHFLTRLAVLCVK